MYLQRGSAASYDIGLVQDGAQPITALSLLSVLSPTADLAASVLTNIAANIQIPGVDLSTVINKDLVLEDAGIIMRQHQPFMVSVSVDDIYGTISTRQILHLAGDLLPFPTGLNIPSTLPDLTLIVNHITGRSQKVGSVPEVSVLIRPVFRRLLPTRQQHRHRRSRGRAGPRRADEV
jgi:hypothetical protein